MTHPRYSPYCLVDFYAVFLKKAFFSGEQRAWEERKAYGMAAYRTFEARRTAYVFYTRTADENILIRRNIQQIEPLNDGFWERDTSHKKNGKGVNCKGLPGHSPDMLIKVNYHSMQICLLFHWSRVHHVT